MYQKCRENGKNRPKKQLISRRLSPGFQLKVAWLMWHKLGNWSNTKETSMSKYLEHNKHPREDTSAQSTHSEFIESYISKTGILRVAKMWRKQTFKTGSKPRQPCATWSRDQSKLRIYSLRRNARRPRATPQCCRISTILAGLNQTIFAMSFSHFSHQSLQCHNLVVF